MDVADLEELVKDIVCRASRLKDRYTDQEYAKVNYACIFSHSDGEYAELVKASQEIGKAIEDTPTGPLFHIKPVETVSGQVKLLKIRRPDKDRVERGDADFTVPEYESFKAICLSKPPFRLIHRPIALR